MSDEEFINSFKMGNTQIIRILYDKNLPSIANHVRKNSGTNTEAESILWEAITILWEKIVQNRFELRNGVTVSTYLFSICVNLWRKELRRIGKYTQKEFADPIDDADYNEENERIYTNRQKVIMDCLSKMGDKCRQVLQLYYFNRLSMADIAKKMGYEHEGIARNTKYKCYPKLEECVKQNYNAQ